MQTDRWLKIAYAYLYIRDFDAAKRAFEQAICDQPENPEYHLHASITAMRSGDHEFALTCAINALELEPSNPLYQHHYSVTLAGQLVAQALVCIGAGDYKTAEQNLQEALTLDSLNEQAAMTLEWVQRKLLET